MMKRWQHITKLQSKLIQEKKLIDCRLDEAIVKHCYLEKSKYEILPYVVTPNIPSHMKCKILTIFQTQYNTHYPWHHLPHHSKATLHNIITKTPVNTTPQSKFPRISKQEVIYNFHNEIDDTELLKADYD